MLHRQVEQIGLILLARQQRVAVAESCTGGLISAALTDVAGSSAWFGDGLVTYSNQAKQSLLGVSAVLLHSEGAVSERVAQAMAQGALYKTAAHWALAVTGIAGPGGGSNAKPVGTVWMAIAECTGMCTAWHHRFTGERAQIRQQTVRTILERFFRVLSQ